MVLWMCLFGCGSSPASRFYLLSPVQGPGGDVRPASEACVSLGIGPIRIPDYLDQPSIVIRSAPNEIKASETNRWAEPLKNNFTRVLAQNLTNLLCTKSIFFYPWKGGVPIDYRVEVEVVRFEGVSGGQVSLEAWWGILSREGKTLHVSKRSTFSESVSGEGYQSLVSTQSRLLENLSREIATSLKALPSP
jgi:uncharacterized lipoprotein YmbA